EMTQAERIAKLEDNSRAIRFGSRKMPEPMTMPITIVVASNRPSLRGSSIAPLDSTWFAVLSMNQIDRSPSAGLDYRYAKTGFSHGDAGGFGAAGSNGGSAAALGRSVFRAGGDRHSA